MPKVKPLFSALEQAVESLNRNKGTGQAFINDLLKNPAVKPAELADRGIDTTLKAMPQVDKPTLKKIVQSKPAPQIKQKTLGAPDYRDLDKQEHSYLSSLEDHFDRVGIDNIDPHDYAELMELQNIRDKSTFDTLSDEQSKIYKQINKARDAGNMSKVKMLKQDVDHLDNRIEHLDNMKIVSPYHEGLTIPNGENYREMLLTLPNGGFGGVSAHFGGEPNIIASMRLKDRLGPNGEKVLHLEELQSDWHQQGREHGYKEGDNSATISEIKKQIENGSKEFQDLTLKIFNAKSDEEKALLLAQQKEIGNNQQKLKQAFDKEEVKNTKGVPDAPFKKNWEELALKHLVNHAVENGYDKIAVTPGAVQADRFSLAKYINDVQYDPKIKHLTAQGKNGEAINKIVEPNELSDYVGKEVANNLLQTELNQGRHKLSGLDLQTGGEGMKAAYDQRIPNILNKLGKPFGAQTEMNAMPVETGKQVMVPDNAGLGMISSGQPETANLHTFDITPEMKQQVQTEGFPMYKKGGKVKFNEGGYNELPDTDLRIDPRMFVQKMGDNSMADMSLNVPMRDVDLGAGISSMAPPSQNIQSGNVSQYHTPYLQAGTNVGGVRLSGRMMEPAPNVTNTNLMANVPVGSGQLGLGVMNTKTPYMNELSNANLNYNMPVGRGRLNANVNRNLQNKQNQVNVNYTLPFKKGGKVYISDNPDTQWAELEFKRK